MPNAIMPFEGFIVIWVFYGLIGLPLWFGNNIELKRRYLRPHIIGAGILFLLGMLLTGFPVFLLIIAVPMITLITALNLRQLRWCQSCGATAWNSLPFQRPRFCGRCGAAFEDSSASAR